MSVQRARTRLVEQLGAASKAGSNVKARALRWYLPDAMLSAGGRIVNGYHLPLAAELQEKCGITKTAVARTLGYAPATLQRSVDIETRLDYLARCQREVVDRTRERLEINLGLASRDGSLRRKHILDVCSDVLGSLGFDNPRYYLLDQRTPGDELIDISRGGSPSDQISAFASGGENFAHVAGNLLLRINYGPLQSLIVVAGGENYLPGGAATLEEICDLLQERIGEVLLKRSAYHAVRAQARSAQALLALSNNLHDRAIDAVAANEPLMIGPELVAVLPRLFPRLSKAGLFVSDVEGNGLVTLVSLGLDLSSIDGRLSDDRIAETGIDLFTIARSVYRIDTRIVIGGRGVQRQILSGRPPVDILAGWCAAPVFSAGAERAKLGVLALEAEAGRVLDVEHKEAFMQLVRVVGNALTTELVVAELRRLAEYDALTQLFNRGHVYNQSNGTSGKLVDDFAAVQPADGSLALLLLDIDHFKRVNDQYGHPAGDRVLMQLADLIRNALDEAAAITQTRIMYDPYAARWGGEEFAIVMRGVDHAAAQHFAEALRARIERHSFDVGYGRVLTITGSIGFATTYAGDQMNEVAALVQAADQALYESKDSGRNRVTSSSRVL